jgi:hypothetical protein
MYKNQTTPDSGGSPPTSTNSDVAATDKEGVPLDEAVGKLLEGMKHLGDARANTLDSARIVGCFSVSLKTIICCDRLVGPPVFVGPNDFPFLLCRSHAPDSEQIETRSHPHSLFKI